eukprot:TRINITY_DN122_c0_g2_i1.p1 TRINITY_DN122_c0_g2~~TRINITY_DN122_c0_g2_i1.p1  ORF type:complete len:172 (+),score=44.19 TRINITY_DN122_c0_g2_i1:64-579(+)
MFTFLALTVAVLTTSQAPSGAVCMKKMLDLCGNFERTGTACYDCIKNTTNHQVLSPLCHGTHMGDYFCNSSLPGVNKADCLISMRQNCAPSDTCQKDCLPTYFVQLQPICHGTGSGKYVCNTTTSDCVGLAAAKCPNQPTPQACKTCVATNKVFQGCQDAAAELEGWYCGN